jgi:hypothetical protein
MDNSRSDSARPAAQKAPAQKGFQQKQLAAPLLGGGKLGYSIEEFAAASGIGRTRLYSAIKAGQLRARKFGKRTVILAPDGREFLENLPELPRAA